MNWLKIGSNVAPFLATLILSVAAVILGFRRWVAPDIVKALEKAQMTITNLAKLGGVKSQEFKDMQAVEKIVGKDLIDQNIPEMEALRLFLSPSAWEQIEETIEENPAAVIQLYEKYGHLLGGASQKREEYQY